MGRNDIEGKPKNPEGCADVFIGSRDVALKSGLYVVATPIGNLRDMSLRALDVLRHADMVVCEDTRVTRKLLNAYDIQAKLHSYNDHSDDARRESIVAQLKEGRVIALVSDAGMPLISDPGYKLVRDCIAENLYVTTVPGASAPLAALQISGLPSDRFCFLGFLPHKTKARRNVLEEWADVPATLIAFESGPRLIASLTDIKHVMGAREVAVVREITKLYEEVRKDSVYALLSYYEEHGVPKGEIVLVIVPPELEQFDEDAVLDMIRNALKTMKINEAAKHVAEKTGLKKRDLYALALKVSAEEE